MVQNKEELAAAKAKFIDSMIEAGPSKMIGHRPLTSIAAVMLAGIVTGVSGNAIGRTLLPAPQIAAAIAKRLLK
jgi:hypothetical protein